MIKNPPANAGDTRDVGSIPGLGRSPGEGSGNLTPVFLPGKSHGQRSLVGYNPWSHKELDMTEHCAPNKRDPGEHPHSFCRIRTQREESYV